MGASLILLNLAGHVALLLWGLYMLQGGIMRAFGTNIRKYLGAALRNRTKAFLAGLGATTLLQSSTATGLMATSFTASRMVGLVPALALMLGANVGTTLIVQIFSFDISKVAPVIILGGVIMFRRSGKTNVRDFARSIIGLGLMLMGLELMVALLKPAEQSQAIKLLLNTISSDHILDMIFAALLTWIMHSSVAVVLVAMSFATQHLIPLDVAYSLVLGANLGSAVNPLVESSAGGNPAARRLPFGNLINRSIGCLVVLPMVTYLELYTPQEYKMDPAKAVAWFHTLFNIAMAVVFFPLLPLVAKLLQRILPEKISSLDLSEPLYLDAKALERPSLALANAAREALRMADLAEKMLNATMELLSNSDRKKIHEIVQMDDVMDKLNMQIKNYITALTLEKMSEDDIKRASEILGFAMNLEHIGDIVGGGLVKLGGKMVERKLVFSPDGWAELKHMLERVTGNTRLASAVFMTRELRSAKQLMAEKGVIRDMETSATEQHFKRLREGRTDSKETSNIHLDIVRDLKRINSHLTATAITVLEENGQLLQSRLKAE